MDDWMERLRRNTRPLVAPGILGALPHDTDIPNAPLVIDLNTPEGQQQAAVEEAIRSGTPRSVQQATSPEPRLPDGWHPSGISETQPPGRPIDLGSFVYDATRDKKPGPLIIQARGRPVRVRYAVRVRVTYHPRKLGGLVEAWTERTVLEEAEFTARPIRLEYEGQLYVHFAGRGDLRFRMPADRIIWMRYRDPRC